MARTPFGSEREGSGTWLWCYEHHNVCWKSHGEIMAVVCSDLVYRRLCSSLRGREGKRAHACMLMSMRWVELWSRAWRCVYVCVCVCVCVSLLPSISFSLSRSLSRSLSLLLSISLSLSLFFLSSFTLCMRVRLEPWDFDSGCVTLDLDAPAVRPYSRLVCFETRDFLETVQNIRSNSKGSDTACCIVIPKYFCRYCLPGRGLHNVDLLSLIRSGGVNYNNRNDTKTW